MQQEELVGALQRGVCSPDPSLRERAADEVTDVHRGLAEPAVASLARSLVAARLAEATPACQEAQLNALADLKAWHHIDAHVLEPLQGLREPTLPRGQMQHLDDLLDDP
jgi:hypothetical protein